MTTAIVWLRQDLRLADNAALYHACQSADRVLVLYVHAPEELAPWSPGGASRWWLHHSLQALQQALHKHGASLLIRAGSSLEVVRELVAQSGAEAVYCNALYEPAAVARDRAVAQQLQVLGVAWQQYHSNVLFAPGSVVNKQNSPYRVFTPFWRACLQALHVEAPLPPPTRIPGVDEITSNTLNRLGLLPTIAWDKGLREAWHAGEDAAHEVLEEFCSAAIANYATTRDIPGVRGTSRLSAYLHFGEISPRQVVWRLQQALQSAGVANHAETYLREIGWREFAIHTLHFFPKTTDAAMDQRFNHFPWRNDAESLQAWQQGRTGFPIIDAGMRELRCTGWMHNRVRMIVASFLTKNALLPWQEGARWFWDNLVDADLASNTMGWQWVAGCGVDAAPYFRIFNPVTQSKKFGGNGDYIRQWVPELSALPSRWIHEPWLVSPCQLATANVRLGGNYPLPILELAKTRACALQAYKSLAEYSSAAP